jgi:lambda family phage portal protein
VTDFTQSIVVSATPSTSGSPSVPKRAASAPAPVRLPARSIESRYDVAQRNEENARLWQNADHLSARAANDPAVRFNLRNRARYETSNNSYAKGVVLTMANEVVGTGPRVQFLTGDRELNRELARSFDEWAAEIRYAEKLRTAYMARLTDGETFPVLSSNPRLQRTPIQLDIRLVEADQVADPAMALNDPLNVDGIRFDRWGNPVSYRVLEDHPGDALQFAMGRYEELPASMVMHWFRCDRPGQARGIPELTPALKLFGELRRYTAAVLAAAETAADFAAVLYTEMPPDGETDPTEPLDLLNIERRLMTTLPAGWKMGQFKAEQPTTTYAMFKAEILNEIFRCLLMPYNIGAGNSSGYNYASGRLDHQGFFKAIGVIQYDCETAILDRVLAAWLSEAVLAGMVPREFAAAPHRVPHQWFWDGTEHVDPSKEAVAQEKRLKNGTTTLADEWAKKGFDWREKATQQAEERAFYAGLGIPYPGDAPAPANPNRPAPSDPDEEDEGDEDADSG